MFNFFLEKKNIQNHLEIVSPKKIYKSKKKNRVKFVILLI